MQSAYLKTFNLKFRSLSVKRHNPEQWNLIQISRKINFFCHRLKNNNERPAIEIVKKYATLPLLECYPAQLNQVFMNLLSNSIDALEEKFKTIQQRYLKLSQRCPKIPLTIWISTQAVNNLIVIRIADNGLVIPEEVRSHMFDPFFTTKAPGKGTGLGLSISHQIIVEKHHGQIKCSSKPGEGTEFLIEIPTDN